MSKHRPSNNPDRMLQVAVLVDTSTDWGRQLIRGITTYAQKHGPWHLQVEPRGRNEQVQLPKNWEGDGIIARVANHKIAEDLRFINVPIVNISGIELDGVSFPRVTTDYEAVAELAAEHFISRGFQRFAYVGPFKLSYVKQHADAFERRISAHGSQLERFDYAHESMASQRWLKQSQRLGSWLTKLDKPIAIFSWGTTASCQLLDVCRFRKILVPDDVAVLAGDNDDVISETTVPPLSAILNPSKQVGYRAAKRLDRLVRRQQDHGEDERIPPIEVVTRGSTEVLAIEDEELTLAVQFIRRNAFSVLTVRQVADSVPMTRRSLERKFKKWIGRTPLEEIRRLRIARVKELLATTDLAISRVAEATGFGTPEYMTTVFKQEMGLTPLRYRSTVRAR
ncbi:substrate-binding domain-containing protein [Novipirellula herctigrandis]